MTEIVDIKEISSTEDVEEAGAAAELVKSEDTIQQQDNANEETEEDEEAPKRYLPDHKKPDAAPTFPEKLMSLMRHVEKLDAGENFCVAWCDGGKSFVINHPEDFTRKVVPLFFKATKWSSFTRKLYRWGFRQINRGIGPDDPIIFGNEFFQRDNEELIAKMRSVTASSAGKQDHAEMMAGMKRSFGYDEGAQKRMMFGHFLHQQKNMNMMQGNIYGAMNPNGSIPLNNALRPGLNMNSQAQAMNVMRGPQMMMVPRVQNGQPVMMNTMMNQMVVGPMAPPAMGQMVPMNPAMQQIPRFHLGQIGNSGNHQVSRTSQTRQTQQQPPNPQSTADIVNAAIAALRHAS